MNTQLLDASESSALAKVVAILQQGGIVGMPTETVYGLAGNALDTNVAAKIYAAKQRPSFDPLIVHVKNLQQALGLAHFSQLALRLADTFWPGPLTLVLPKRNTVPELITSGLAHVGLRCPAHPIAQHLLQATNLCLAAPSANSFASISPVCARDVMQELSGKIDAVLDGGTCAKGLESTVVRVDSEQGISVLRLGALSVEELSSTLPDVEITIVQSSSDPGAHAAPGMAKRHYSPKTPMSYHQQLPPLGTHAGKALLCMTAPRVHGYAHVCALSESGDTVEAAAKLYQCLRQLDHSQYAGIDALEFPNQSLGRAINDRLRRASH